MGRRLRQGPARRPPGRPGAGREVRPAALHRADPRWKSSSRTRVRFGHAVVAPYTDARRRLRDAGLPALDDQRAWRPGRPRRAALGRRRAPGERPPRALPRGLRAHRRRSSRAATCRSAALLAEADERETRADRLTVEQATILGVTRLLNRVEVRGGAGSGKTVLAMTQAKELTRGEPRDAGSAGRAALLLRGAGQLVQALHGHGRPTAPPGIRRYLRGPRGLPGSGGVRRPRRRDVLGGAASRGRWPSSWPTCPTGKKFDAVVVDEAQDFADLWWTPIMRCLRDEEQRRAVRLQRREPAGVRALRPAAGAAGAARARPQPAQHQADRARRSCRWRRCGCTPAVATGRR